MRRGGMIGLAAGVVVALFAASGPWTSGREPAAPAPALEPDGPAAPSNVPDDRGDAVRSAPDVLGDHARETPGQFVLRAWVPGGFESSVLADVVALPGVVSATLARTETVGLTASRDARGEVVEEHQDGWQVPVAVTVVESPARTGEEPGPDDGEIEAFGPGDVVLTRTGASLRAIGVGGEIDLVGRSGLRVAAIVPDDRLPRSEVGIHPADAEALGMPPVGAITILHAASSPAAIRTLATALGGLASDGADVRVAAVSGGTPLAPPIVLSLPERKATFGEFAYRDRQGVREIDIDPAFVAANIVDANVPLLGTVRCHRAIIDDLRVALEDLAAAGLGDWIDPRRYGGCFHARHIRVERPRLSTHAWGAAIDINVDFSVPGLGPRPPDEMIEILGRHGFRWGGDFRTPDHHHWEWIGPGASERPDR